MEQQQANVPAVTVENVSTVEETNIPHFRYHGAAIVISAWQFPREGWKFQLTPMGEAGKQSQGYIILPSIEDAMQLQQDLSRVLRDRGIIV